MQFLNSRNRRDSSQLSWKLFSIEPPRRVSKLALFGHRRGDCPVKVAIVRERDSDRISIISEDNVAASPRVSLSSSAGSKIEDDQIVTIKVKKEIIGENGLRGDTQIPSDFLPSDALDELGLPWVRVRTKEGDEVKSVWKVPQILDPAQIQSLIRFTKVRMVEGERKSPLPSSPFALDVHVF